MSSHVLSYGLDSKVFFSSTEDLGNSLPGHRKQKENGKREKNQIINSHKCKSCMRKNMVMLYYLTQ